MRYEVFIVSSDDVRINGAMINAAKAQHIGFCFSDDPTPLPALSTFKEILDLEISTRTFSMDFSLSAIDTDLIKEYLMLEEIKQRKADNEYFERMRKAEMEFCAQRIQSLVSELSVEFPEEKVFNHKPYVSKFTQPKYAENNFRRSGFSTSGKLARGRI